MAQRVWAIETWPRKDLDLLTFDSVRCLCSPVTLFNLLLIISQVQFILFGPEDVAKVGRAPWLVTSFVPASTSTLTPSTHLASVNAVTTFEVLGRS